MIIAITIVPSVAIIYSNTAQLIHLFLGYQASINIRTRPIMAPTIEKISNITSNIQSHS